MPDHKLNSKFHFRFTHDEVGEMEKSLKENNNVPPSFQLAKALAQKFSKTRHLNGPSYVHSDSVHNWFKRRRHLLIKARKDLSSVKSLKPSITTFDTEMTLAPVEFKDKHNSDNEETSCKSGSEEYSENGNNGEGTSGPIVPSSSVSNSVESVDQMDVSPKPVPFLQNSVSDVGSVLARLAQFKRVPMDVISKSSLVLNDVSINTSGESSNDMVDRARSILAKLAGISLVDFKRCQIEFDMAFRILVERGSLSDTKRIELMSLHERIVKICKENDLAQEELSECDGFTEKITDAKEDANKLMKKAVLLKEKYKRFPEDMAAASKRISELEAALLQAKAELEIKKVEQADIHNKLSMLHELLESVNNHMMSMKAEEACMIIKQVEAKEVLEKSTEEWVQVTRAKGLIAIVL